MTDADVFDDDYDFVEAYEELLEKGDHKGLIAFCEREVGRRAGDLHAVEQLIDAHQICGNHQQALEIAAKVHHENSDIQAFQFLILHSLFALGKTEDEFAWSDRPGVFRLGIDVSDRCYQFLHPKRKPRDTYELRHELEQDGYCAFSDEELLDHLRGDPRFTVSDDEPMFATISIVRGRASQQS